MYNKELENKEYDIKEIELLYSSKVDFDSLIKTLNKVFNYRFSYDVIHIKENLYKVQIQTPVKSACDFIEAISCEQLKIKIEETIITLVKRHFTCAKDENLTSVDESINNDVNTTNFALAIIEEIEKVEINMNINKDKISQKQIDFINEFKNKYQITDEKFNNCINMWNETVKGNITTKQQLAQANYDTVQSFINWIINIEEKKNKGVTFVTPSSDQTGILW